MIVLWKKWSIDEELMFPMKLLPSGYFNLFHIAVENHIVS